MTDQDTVEAVKSRLTGRPTETQLRKAAMDLHDMLGHPFVEAQTGRRYYKYMHEGTVYEAYLDDIVAEAFK